MSDFLVVGKKGTGKTKYCVRIIRDALSQGRRVATNLDLYLENLLPPTSKAVVVRLPDKPTSEDVKALGMGNDSKDYDEDRNGVIVLDELGKWMNARSYQEKGRQDFLDFMIHSRKLGWDTYFICQSSVQVDKQLRESQIEYIVRCIRMDKVKIPIIGSLLSLFGKGYLRGLHYATTRLSDVADVVIDREWFKGSDVHNGYDTRQVFKTDCGHGAYSMLSAWHLKGRYLPPKQKFSFYKFFFQYKPKPRITKPLDPFIAKLKDSELLTDDSKLRIAAVYVRSMHITGSQGEAL